MLEIFLYATLVILIVVSVAAGIVYLSISNKHHKTHKHA
jgi:hypothetical protein